MERGLRHEGRSKLFLKHVQTCSFWTLSQHIGCPFSEGCCSGLPSWVVFPLLLLLCVYQQQNTKKDMSEDFLITLSSLQKMLHFKMSDHCKRHRGVAEEDDGHPVSDKRTTPKH